MSVIETMKIMPSHKSQGDYIEINVSDFDKDIHKEYQVKNEKPETKSEVATKPREGKKSAKTNKK